MSAKINPSRGSFTIDGYPVKYYGYPDRTRPNGYRVLRLYLLEKYKVCYFCGRTVKDYPHREGVAMKYDDLATIDHLKPRPHIKIPGRKRGEVVEKVLACYRCNHDRNTTNLRSGKL